MKITESLTPDIVLMATLITKISSYGQPIANGFNKQSPFNPVTEFNFAFWAQRQFGDCLTLQLLVPYRRVHDIVNHQFKKFQLKFTDLRI